jgi:hypothetical protein
VETPLVFGCKCNETVIPEYRKLLEQARLQIQDLQEHVLKLQAGWDKERQGLLTQLSEVALPQLVALRNPRQPQPGNPSAMPPKPHFPAFEPKRPPVTQEKLAELGMKTSGS